MKRRELAFLSLGLAALEPTSALGAPLHHPGTPTFASGEDSQGHVDLHLRQSGSKLSTAGARASQAAAAAARSRQLLWRILGHHDGEHQVADVPASSLPNATCSRSSYFVDWGSSGMKVSMQFAAHAGGPPPLKSAFVSGSQDTVKVSGVDVGTPTGELRGILDELLAHLPEGARAPEAKGFAAVLATAGLRLDPEQASASWEAVRAWATGNPGLFGRCGGSSDNADCQTIPGSVEARYEMQSALRSLGPYGLSPGGFASAGGASIQVGFRGNSSSLARCLSDIEPLPTSLDAKRAAVDSVDGSQALLVSFLSSSRLPAEKRTCQVISGRRACDYQAGGMNEMRASFDSFLLAQGHSSNPCLPPGAKLQASEECSKYFSLNVTKCILDKYDGMISSLPPAQAESAEAGRRSCQELALQFLQQDLMVSRWAASPDCTGLAGGVGQWAMLTNFKYSAEAVAPKAVTFRDFEDAAKTTVFSTPEDIEEGVVGKVLSATLLTTFLELLGVAGSAELTETAADWATEAAMERELSLGWLKAGHCGAGAPQRQPKQKELDEGSPKDEQPAQPRGAAPPAVAVPRFALWVSCLTSAMLSAFAW